jgi:PAS domain S-box-containing protein
MNENSGRVSALDGWPVQAEGAEQRYLSILDASPDLICRFEPDTTLTFVNRAYAEYFQSSPEALIGRRFLDFVPAEAHAEIRTHLDAITPDSPSNSYEHVVSLPDGTQAWQYWTDIGLFDDAGQLAEFQSIGRDVTYVRKLQEELEAKNLALTGRDEELRLVLDNIPSRVWYKDDKNRILRLNQAAARSMGVPREVAEGANTYDLFGPMARKYHDDDLQVIESGEPALGLVERYTPASGEDGWVSTDKIPFPDPVTGERRLLVVATDISELKRQEAQLQIVNRNLDNFAALASHDLKAPLRHITVYCEMLQNDHAETLDEDAREHLARIRTSAERMRAIIGTFLEFARSTPTEADMVGIELTRAMNDAAAAISADVQRSGGRLNLPDGPIPVRGDLALLTQLFQNLFENAIRFARSDVPPEVTVSAENNAGFWTIAVQDNGIGIESSKQDTVFDLFARGKPARPDCDGGNGIGLALCRRIAVLHGGSISVDSETAVGSRFLLSLEESREATT